MKDLVSLKLAIFLKEFGYNELCHHYRQKSAVIDNETILPVMSIKEGKKLIFEDWNNIKTEVPFYSMPFISEVIKWIDDKYGIYIQSLFWSHENIIMISNRSDPTTVIKVFSVDRYKSKKKAYCEAIRYVLESLK